MSAGCTVVFEYGGEEPDIHVSGPEGGESGDCVVRLVGLVLLVGGFYADLFRTWIAVTGQRDEYYMNCASVSITGKGTSTLGDYPDMFVGDMTLPGQIGMGECRSTAGAALLFPDPGPASRITETKVPKIGFRKPTEGRCFAPKKGGSGVPVKPPAEVGGGKAPVGNVVYVEEFGCGG